MNNKFEYDLSIIIISYNNLNDLTVCLDSILKYHQNDGIQIIIVAFNFTFDNLSVISSKYPKVIIEETYGLVGFSENNNRGLQHAKGEYTLILNDDTYFIDNCLEKMIARAKTLPENTILSPKFLYFNGHTQFEGRSKASLLYFILMDLKLSNLLPCGDKSKSFFETYNISGACFLINTNFFKSIGFFDEKYYFSPEDLAVSTKVIQNGGKCYVDTNCIVYHKASSTAKSLHQIIIPVTKQGNYFFLREYVGKSQEIFFRFFTFIFSALKVLIWFFNFKNISRRKILISANINCMKYAFSNIMPSDLFKSLYKKYFDINYNKDISSLNILFVTNMYPVQSFKYFGIHVKEQIESLEQYCKIKANIYFINGLKAKYNYFKSIFEIPKIISKNNYDLVHIHYGISGLFLLFFKPKIPVLVTLHSGELFQKKGFLNHIMQKLITLSVVAKSNKVIILNKEMELELDKYKNRLITIPCGVNTNFFRPKSDSKNTRKIRIGFPGNKQRPEKNYSFFEEVLSHLMHYDIEIVEFHNMSRNEVLDNLNGIDLLVMTSLVEGSPQIIKEALALNKPIVSSNVGDVSFLLENVNNCYVINNWNAPDFADAIINVMNLPFCKRVSNGRQMLKEKQLDSEAVSKRLEAVYKSLVKRSK